MWMHSLLNEMGDLFTQDVEKAVRMPSSPQSLLARLTFRNPRSLKPGDLCIRGDIALVDKDQVRQYLSRLDMHKKVRKKDPGQSATLQSLEGDGAAEFGNCFQAHEGSDSCQE